MAQLNTRTALVAKLLADQQKERRGRPIFSTGQGFANLGSDLIAALAQRDAAKERETATADDRKALQFALTGRKDFFDPDNPDVLLEKGTAPGSPETLAIAASLAGTPEQARQITGLGLQQQFANQEAQRQGLNRKPSAFQEKVAALMGQNIPEETAVKIASGTLVADRDPVTGVSQLLDKSTGEIVNRNLAPVPEPQGIQPQEARQPPQQVEAGQDFSEVFGPRGAVLNAANVVSDFFGFGQPAEQADQAAATLKNLNATTLSVIRAGFGGRPNVELQKKFDDLTPKPNELFTGDERARNKLESLTSALDAERSRLAENLSKGGFRPVTVDAMKQKISALGQLSESYGQILNSFPKKDLPPLESFIIK